MGNAFKLSLHLEHIVKDIVNRQKVHYTEEGLRELKYDLKESKEARKILDNIDALIPAEQEKDPRVH